jgi:hypothetical protein
MSEINEELINRIIEVTGRKTTTMKIKDVLLITGMTITLIAAIVGWIKPIGELVIKTRELERVQKELEKRVYDMDQRGTQSLPGVAARLHKVEVVLWNKYPEYQLFLTNPEDNITTRGSGGTTLPSFDNTFRFEKDKNKQ